LRRLFGEELPIGWLGCFGIGSVKKILRIANGVGFAALSVGLFCCVIHFGKPTGVNERTNGSFKCGNVSWS
jgi:hypothetical protein